MFSTSRVHTLVCAALPVLLTLACGGDSSPPADVESTDVPSGTATSVTTEDATTTSTGTDRDVESTVPDTGTSTRPDATEPDVSEPDVSEPDTSNGSDTDDGRNACGGLDPLLLDGELATVGAICGPCADGVVSCLGTDLVFCEGASTENVCGGCEDLPGRPMERCDECAVWACMGEELHCVPGRTGPECDEPLPVCGDLDCAGVGRRCIEDDIVGAFCGGCLTGFEAVGSECRPPLVAPEVEASEGMFADRVELAWDAVEGATGYAVYVEDERVAEVDADLEEERQVWADEAAPGGAFGAVAAVMEPGLEAATITLTGAPGTGGAAVVYTVRAIDSVRAGPLSEEVEGWRGAPAVDRFQWEVDGAWVDVADTFTVESGPPGLEAGEATASQGTRVEGVELRAIGAGAVRGEEVTVRVRAVDESGLTGGQTSVVAWRAVESSEVVWEVAETAEGPFALLGLSGEEALDEEADGFGEPRWYRACVEAAGLEQVCGGVVEGWRRSTEPVPEIAEVVEVGVTRVVVEVRLSPEGSPPADRLGACAQRFGVMPVCQMGEETAGDVTFTFEGLAAGQRYSVRAVAERLGEVFNGGSASVRLLPAAVEGVVAVDAGDGTVAVSWPATDGAATYDVLRDGEVVAAGVVGTSFVDEDVEGWSLGGLEVLASDDRVDGTVEVSWTGLAGEDGGTYVYAVVARNQDGVAGESSEGVEVSLTAPEVVGYEVRAGDGEWADVGAVLVWLDESPPMPVLEAGELVRVDPESGEAVSWTVEGAGALPGAERTYGVRAMLTGGAEPVEASASGRAGVGAVEVRWERSEGEELPEGEDGWEELDGEGFSLVDAGAPEDRAVRWWRAWVEAEPLAAVEVGPSAGHRALEAVTGLVASQGADADVVELTWVAPAGAVGFEVWRDGELVAADVEAAEYRDEEAPAAPAPGAVVPVAVRWDDPEAELTHVRVRWQAPETAPGAEAVYRVVAVSPLGMRSPESGEATGWRGSAAVSGWQVSRGTEADPEPAFVDLDPDDVAVVEVDEEPWFEWLDEEAPLHDPAMSLNTRSLNDRIALAWSVVLNEDAVREAEYRVRAVSAAGVGETGEAAMGSRRLVTTADYRLHRTTEEPAVSLTGATDAPVSGTWDDPGARIDGGADTYRLTWFAPNVGERVLTATETRALHAPSVSITGTTPAATMGWFVDFAVALPGNAAPGSVILCMASGQGASNPSNPTAWCETHPRPWEATTETFSLPGDPSRAPGSTPWASLWVPGEGEPLVRVQVTVP